MGIDREAAEAAIAALEAQREALGDEVVDRALAPLRESIGSTADGAAPVEAPALRQVAVMFVDVVDSTAMGRSLDAEEIHAVIDPLLRRCTSVIEARRGRVLKYTGDGMLAVFGADEAAEDAPEQSVQAGLDLLAAVQGGELRVRVGVDVGMVLLGGGVEREQTIRGTTVNMAARMEQHAPIGGLRITAATRRLVRDRFELDEQPPLLIKGFDEPQVTYLVVRPMPRSFRAPGRGVDGVITSMVGRDRELLALQRAYSSSGRFRSAVVVGPAGIGKSRLLQAMEQWLAAQSPGPTFLRARAQRHTRRQAFGLVRDVVAERLGITDNEPADTAKRRLEEGLAPRLGAVGEAEAAVHLLGHLIGFDYASSPHLRGIIGDATQIRSRAFQAATGVIASLAAEAPVVLLLEDLHWADDGSLDFLEQLATALGHLPLFVLATARPELGERRQLLAHDQHGARVQLDPLEEQDRGALASELLAGLGEVPFELRDLLVDRGDGNPYFMEELVGMLVDDGTITVDSHGRWRASLERLAATEVPPSLRGVLQSRFDALTPGEQAALQAAAVIGFVHWDTAIAAIDPGAAEHLNRLVERGYLLARPTSAIADAAELTFVHHLMHQFVYDTILKAPRQALHAGVAAWYEPMGTERGPEYLALTGEHYERAGETVRAVEYLARAAEGAFSRGACDAAVELVERALELVAPGDHAWRWRLQVVHEGVLSLGDDRASHRRVLDDLATLAETLDDDHRRAVAAERKATARYEEGEHSAAELEARRAIALAEEVGDPHLEVRALAVLASTLRRLDRREEALARAQRGLMLATSSGDTAAELQVRCSLASVFVEELAIDEAKEQAERALTLARELGDRVREADALNRLGGIRYLVADFAGACRYLEQSLEVARVCGSIYGQCIASLNLAGNLLFVGDIDRSLRVGQAALDLAILAGTRDLEAACRAQMGLSLAAVGRWDEAIAAHHAARDLFILNECVQYTMDPLSGLAAAHLGKGDVAGAVVHVDEILRYLHAVGNLHGADDPAGVFWRCYQVLARAEDDRAAAVLDVANEWLDDVAKRLTDPADRERFLSAEPAQRGIRDAWRRVAAGRSTTRGGS